MAERGLGQFAPADVRLQQLIDLRQFGRAFRHPEFELVLRLLQSRFRRLLLRHVAAVGQHPVDLAPLVAEGPLIRVEDPECAVGEGGRVVRIVGQAPLEGLAVVGVKAANALLRIAVAELRRPEVRVRPPDHRLRRDPLRHREAPIGQEKPMRPILDENPVRRRIDDFLQQPARLVQVRCARPDQPFKLVVKPPRRFFRLDALRDIRGQPGDPGHLPRLVSHGEGPVFDPADSPIRLEHAVSLSILAVGLFHRRRHPDSIPIIRMDGLQPGSRLLVQTPTTPPPDLLIRGAHVEDLVLVGSRQPKHFLNRFGHLAEARFALYQRIFGLLGFGHVLADDEREGFGIRRRRRRRRRRQDSGHFPDPKDCSVLLHFSKLTVEPTGTMRARLRERVVERPLGRLLILGMEEGQHGSAEQLFRLVAQMLRAVPIDRSNRAARGDRKVHGRNLFIERAIARFAGREGLVRGLPLDRHGDMAGDGLRQMDFGVREPMRRVVVQHELAQQSVRGPQRDKAERRNALRREDLPIGLERGLLRNIDDADRLRLHGRRRPGRMPFDATPVRLRQALRGLEPEDPVRVEAQDGDPVGAQGAPDARHGGLVHVRQRGGAGQSRRQLVEDGLLLQMPDPLFFRLSTRRDVAHETMVTDVVTRCIDPLHHQDLLVEAPAILADGARLELRLALLAQAFVGRRGDRQILGMQGRREMRADHLGRLVAHHLRVEVVDEFVFPPRVQARDAGHGLAQGHVLLPCLLLQAPPARHIDDRTENRRRAIVLDRRQPDLDREFASVLSAREEFPACAHAPGLRRAHESPAKLGVALPIPFRDQVLDRQVQQLVPRIAEHALDLFIHQTDGAVGLDHQQAARRGLDDLAEPGFTGAALLFRVLMFDRQPGQVRRRPDEFQLAQSRPPRRAVIHGEGAERAPSAGEDGRRPAGPQSMLEGEVPVVGPEGIDGDVLDDHRPLGVGGGAARTDRRPDGHPVDGRVVGVREARRRRAPKPRPRRVEQEDGPEHVRRLTFHHPHQRIERLGERRRTGDLLENSRAPGRQLFGPMPFDRFLDQSIAADFQFLRARLDAPFQVGLDDVERLFGPLDLGHVDGKDDHAGDATRFIQGGNLVGADDPFFAGRGGVGLENAQFRLAGRDDFQVVTMIGRRFFRVEFVAGSAFQRADRLIERVCGRLVEPQNAVLSVLVPDHRGHRVQHHPPFALQRAQAGGPRIRFVARPHQSPGAPVQHQADQAARARGRSDERIDQGAPRPRLRVEHQEPLSAGHRERHRERLAGRPITRVGRCREL